MLAPLFRTLLVLSFATAFAASACVEPAERAAPATQAAEAPPPSPAPAAPPAPQVAPAPENMPPATPPPPPPTCGPMTEEFARTLREGHARCHEDADCACYPGGVGEASGCGGVTDMDTAAALYRVATRFRAAGCPNTQECAAWECRPTCQQGRCVR